LRALERRDTASVGRLVAIERAPGSPPTAAKPQKPAKPAKKPAAT